MENRSFRKDCDWPCKAISSNLIVEEYPTFVLAFVGTQVVCVLRPQCTLVFVSVSHYLLMAAIA